MLPYFGFAPARISAWTTWVDPDTTEFDTSTF